MFSLSIWAVPPFAAACIATAAYLRARQRIRAPGGSALQFGFATIMFWSIGQTLSVLLTGTHATLAAAQIAYVGIAFAPVAWMMFALTYSGRVMRASRTTINMLAGIPFVTVALAVTNDTHGLLWRDWEFFDLAGTTSFTVSYGPWWYVHAVYSYGLILSATSILAFALNQMKQHAQTLAAVVAAPLIGIFFNLLYLSPLNPYPWLDLTTVGFALGVLLLDVGVMRDGALNSLPVARDIVIEQLKDPVLVMSHNGTIVDANLSAFQTWAGKITITHTDVQELVPSLPTSMIASPTKNTEVTIAGKAYDIASTRLDPSNAESNVALVFRDITDRRAAERELKRTRDELQRIAHIDPLTNLYNRRMFMYRLNEEYERVRRHGNVLSVLIFDLDHFKKINDTYGHDQGDAVLQAVADAIGRVKRITDLACRLGGEEFALLLPETDRNGALQLAQRLRASIEKYPYERRLGRKLSVTASVGVATVSADAPGPESLLKIADRALYQAKESGRNCVRTTDDVEATEPNAAES